MIAGRRHTHCEFGRRVETLELGFGPRFKKRRADPAYSLLIFNSRQLDGPDPRCQFQISNWTEKMAPEIANKPDSPFVRFSEREKQEA